MGTRALSLSHTLVLSQSLSMPSTDAVYITCVCERETRATPTTPEDTKVPIGGGADNVSWIVYH